MSATDGECHYFLQFSTDKNERLDMFLRGDLKNLTSFYKDELQARNKRRVANVADLMFLKLYKEGFDNPRRAFNDRLEYKKLKI